MPKIVRTDLLTPANAVTVLGFVLTAAGSVRLDTAGGLYLAIVGRLLDVLDGPVARQTHASNFGALLDSTADKLACLVLLIAAYHYQLVPVAFLLFVFLYQGLVAVMSLDAIRKGWEVHPSILGKYTMFFQIGALLLFVFLQVTGTAHQLINILAIIFACAAVASGIVSLIHYVRRYFQEVFRKAHK